MRPSEASQLLSLAAAFDQRTIGEADAAAWADALDGLSLDECAEAVRAHYRMTDSRVWPSHIRAHAEQARRAEAERLHAERLRLPPVDYDRSHAGYLAAKDALGRAQRVAAERLRP